MTILIKRKSSSDTIENHERIRSGREMDKPGIKSCGLRRWNSKNHGWGRLGAEELESRLEKWSKSHEPRLLSWNNLASNFSALLLKHPFSTVTKSTKKKNQNINSISNQFHKRKENIKGIFWFFPSPNVHLIRELNNPISHNHPISKSSSKLELPILVKTEGPKLRI